MARFLRPRPPSTHSMNLNPLSLFRRKASSRPYESASIVGRGMRLEAVQEIAQSAKAVPSHFAELLRIPLEGLMDDKAYLDIGSGKVWATFKALDIIATATLRAVFKIEGERTGAIVEQGELPRLLKSPNPYDTMEEMLYQWVFQLRLTGRAFWYKADMNSRGQPKEIYPLLPQYMKVIPDPVKRVGGYEYQVNGKLIKFEPEEIIHFRRPHPASQIKGMGDIEPSAELYRNYMAQQKLEQNFRSRGAMPSGILYKKGAPVGDQSQWEKLKAWWKREHEGERNAGKTAFLNGDDWGYIRLGLTQSEMQSIEAQRWDVSQIFNNHGVPLSLVGLEKAANYATAQQDEMNFRKYTVVPTLDILTGKLNSMGPEGMGVLVKAFSPVWRLVYEMAGLIDVEQRTKEYGPLLDRGVITRNEMRELCGLAPLTDPFMDMMTAIGSPVPLEMLGLTDTGAGDEPGGGKPDDRDKDYRGA